MNRRTRQLSTALVAIFALLMSQLALSAHACEMMASPTSVVADSQSPCPGSMDTANLCDQHCQFGNSAVDHGKPLPAFDVTLAPALHIDQPHVFPALPRRSLREMPPSPEPPPAIRFSVLRI